MKWRLTKAMVLPLGGLCALVCLWKFTNVEDRPATAAHQNSPQRPIPVDTLPEALNLAWDAADIGVERITPADNPLTEAKVQLGRKLFFDPILSADGTVACASCHDPQHGFASPDPLAIGIGNQLGRRNAPSLLNVGLGQTFFWDGRAASLEEQALEPIANPLELGSSVGDVIKRLRAHAEYPQQFKAAFANEGTPGEAGDADQHVTADNLAKAIASFERVLVSHGSRVDRFRRSEFTALSNEAKQGLWLFESKANCWKCHSGPNLTDEQFHNTGVSWGAKPTDLGHFELTQDEADRGKFKTPTLRDVARTAPYMHDGSIATLEEVIEFYSKGGGKNSHLDERIQPLNLTDEEKLHLIEYLKALAGSQDWAEGQD